LLKSAVSPSCTELESIVLDWASQMLGLSSSFNLNSSGIGGGYFQNTASEAVLMVIIATRSADKASYPDTKLEDMRIYTTTQTHSLGLKAVATIGTTSSGARDNIAEIGSVDADWAGDQATEACQSSTVAIDLSSALGSLFYFAPSGAFPIIHWVRLRVQFGSNDNES
ncbi:hypothetical protein F5878DRAFT_641590, partial [Lentinula raphanica]